jgi:hypothetical protein
MITFALRRSRVWMKLKDRIVAGDATNWNPIVADPAPGQGLLVLGSVMSAGSDGKMN